MLALRNTSTMIEVLVEGIFPLPEDVRIRAYCEADLNIVTQIHSMTGVKWSIGLYDTLCYPKKRWLPGAALYRS